MSFRCERTHEMNLPNPTQKTKKEYQDLVDLIRLPDSPVGIDAQYTHAIIITYLQQISARLDELETIVSTMKQQ